MFFFSSNPKGFARKSRCVLHFYCWNCLPFYPLLKTPLFIRKEDMRKDCILLISSSVNSPNSNIEAATFSGAWFLVAEYWSHLCDLKQLPCQWSLKQVSLVCFDVLQYVHQNSHVSCCWIGRRILWSGVCISWFVDIITKLFGFEDHTKGRAMKLTQWKDNEDHEQILIPRRKAIGRFWYHIKFYLNQLTVLENGSWYIKMYHIKCLSNGEFQQRNYFTYTLAFTLMTICLWSRREW